MINEKILFVDDEIKVLQGFQRRFRHKLNIDTASSGEEALTLISINEPYAVVISDMQMPEMNGLEFLSKAKEISPDSVRIMLTGNADQKTASDAVNQGQIFRFLTKPCSSDTLFKALQAGVEYYLSCRVDGEQLQQALGNVKDLSERLSFEQTHDSLTNLINRQEFENRIQKELEELKDNGEAHTLFYIDLDLFKVINDSCGHIAGNELLRQITLLLEKHIRGNDTLARIGGDEFGIMLLGCNIEQALVIAERIRVDVNNHHFSWDQKSYRVTISSGLVSIDTNCIDAGKMLSMAETGCRIAKNSGRDRVHISAVDDKILVEHESELQWISRIHEALNKDQFSLYFQTITPVLEQIKGLHYEILVRLKEADGSIIPPGLFLPPAEKYNLSSTIDRWVIRTTFSWLKDHPNHMDELELCSINLSGLSLANLELLNFIIEQFSQTQIPPEKICFEITETVAIGDLPNAMKIIDHLRGMGCRFALDDFGSGLSSYAYLKNLRVDFLKIDGLFVKEIVNNEIDRVMVKSMTEIGHVMGIQIIAEFVENDQILQTLSSIGVDFAQGYGIAKPRPIEELL